MGPITGKRGRRLALAVAAVLTCITAAACLPGGEASNGGSKQASESGHVTITFWTINLKQNYRAYIEGLIHGYEAKHRNVKITWVDVPGDDIVQKLLAAVASSKPPDLVNLAASQVPQFAPALADIGKYVKPDQKSGYIASQYADLTIGGHQVGLPWYNGGGWVTWYDRTAIKKAGLDSANPPQTWDQALDWGKKVHQSDAGLYGFNQIPDIRVLQSYGVKMLSADKKKAAFDTPQAASVLTHWKSYYKTAIAPGALTATENFPQDFCNGGIAMAVNAQPFQLLNYKENCPKVYKRLRVSATVTGSNSDKYLGGLNALVVPAKSSHQSTATDFGAWVSNAANQLAFCKLVTIFPSTQQSLEDDYFKSFSSDATGQARKVVVSELPTLKPSDLGTPVDTQLEQTLQNQVVSYFLGKKSAKQALASAAGQWDKALAS